MTYNLVGDATSPVLKDGKNIIVHVVNDIGAWGAGFVVPLGDKYPLAKSEYKRDFRKFSLGQNQYVVIEQGKLAICNMFAQHKLRSRSNPVPLQYKALGNCLVDLMKFCDRHLCFSIHMPRFGCGLAGGEWSKVSEMVEETFDQTRMNVYIYTPEDK